MEHEPTVPPEHTPFDPAPAIPPPIERAVRNCFKIKVDQDSPAATALYKAAVGLLHIQPLHTPLPHLHTSLTTYIHKQHPLITRAPIPPPPSPGLRWALESPSFHSLTPSQCWVLISKAIVTQAAHLLSLRQHKSALTAATKATELPTELKALLDLADILQPAEPAEHILSTPKDTDTTPQPTPRILYRPPLLYNNPLSNQLTPFSHTLPHPDHPTQSFTLTIFPPFKDMDPGTLDMAQEAEDTKILIQSPLHMSHYPCPNHQPPPGTWLHSLLHQFSAHLPDLTANIPSDHTEHYPELTDLTAFSTLNPFPNGGCMEAHNSKHPGLNCCISLSLPAYTIAIQQTQWAITTGQQTLRGGEWIPQLTTVHIRPAHRSLLGEAQSTNPIFTTSHLPPLHWVKGHLSSHPHQKVNPTLPHLWHILHYLNTNDTARNTLVELIPKASHLERVRHKEAQAPPPQKTPPPPAEPPLSTQENTQGRIKKQRHTQGNSQ